MDKSPSKSQIDRIGERLRDGQPTEADLALLDEYRRGFAEPLQTCNIHIRLHTGLTPTSRPAKSTGSIVGKLRRESARLSQIQDIAGCRIVVSDLARQNQVLDSLQKLFRVSRSLDRRERPSHGYRAIHLMVRVGGRVIEVQIRTELQHLWAQYSEALSDAFDPAIKYGGGDKDQQQALSLLSSMLANLETYTLSRQDLRELKPLLGKETADGPESSATRSEEAVYIQEIDELAAGVVLLLKSEVTRLRAMKGPNP